MQARRIGPIPLLQGVQLSPPSGKPGGLLDVRNMEVRDGHLATRRGLEYRGVAALTTTELTYAAAVTQPSTNWDGQAAGYIGFQTLTTKPGVEIDFEVSPPTTANTVEADYVELSYSVAAGAFKPIPFIWDAREAGEAVVLLGNTTDYLKGKFVCPDDWTAIDVGGTTAFWLRLRLIGQDGTVLNFANLLLSSGTNHVMQHAPPNTEIVEALWAPFRSGPRVVAIAHDGQDETMAMIDYGVVPYSLGDKQANYEQAYSVPGGTEMPDVSMVYLPATDEVVTITNGVKLGGAVFGVRNVGGLSGTDAIVSNITTSEGKVFPDPNVDDTAWQDVPVEGDLGPIAALGLYNQRIFALGGLTQPHTVRWGAPSEFARIMPSDNRYDLTGGGGGALVGSATVGRTMLIFTTTAIWQVNEVDPIEGEDSRMIFNLLEETGCVAKRSIAVVDGRVFFLSSDGVRVFDGARSRVITGDVGDLFAHDSEHPLAIRTVQARSAVAVYDPVEHLYKLGYQTADSQDGNDAALVINTETGACMLWGADWPAYQDTTDATAAVDGRVPRGFRMQAGCWDALERRAWVISRRGIAATLGGTEDMGMPIPWSLETHHVGLGQVGHQMVAEVDLELERITSAVSLDVSVVNDGRLSLKDTRRLSVDQGLATSIGAGADALDLAGNALAEVEDSYVSMTWRGQNRGRNHRVVVESIADDDDPTVGPHPVRIVGISLKVLGMGR